MRPSFAAFKELNYFLILWCLSDVMKCLRYKISTQISCVTYRYLRRPCFFQLLSYHVYPVINYRCVCCQRCSVILKSQIKARFFTRNCCYSISYRNKTFRTLSQTRIQIFYSYTDFAELRWVENNKTLFLSLAAKNYSYEMDFLPKIIIS